LWKVFSNVVKPEKTIRTNGATNDSKALYSFHELIIDALRPTIKEGIRSFLLVSPPRSDYSEALLKHIRGHHSWLVQGPSKAAFSEMIGTATTLSEVTVLTRNPAFSKIIEETTIEETESLIELLEKRLNSTSKEPLVLYSIEEIENQILGSSKPGNPKPEFLLITDTHLSNSRQKNRLHKLLQIATNRKVKTRIVNSETPAGKRLTQFGGMVCILKPE
jgi:stalled ribosome rescue protein Dom34